MFENQAGDVCSPFELFVRTFLLVPCWNVACAHGWQDGGGLYISGTATLTNTNVHANRAAYVCLPSEPSFDISSIAPLERYACAWLAVWRGTLHLGHGNADQHQRVR